MSTSSVIYHVKDVTRYSQVEGRDWWYVRFDDPNRSCSWQPTAYLGDIPPFTKAKMSDMKKRWFSQQVNKYRLLIFLLWAGSVAAFGMAGYLIAQNWDEILANPYAWDVLYTLTMSGKAWSAFCAVTSVLLAVIAIRVQATSLRYYKMRGTRSMRSSGSKRWAGVSSSTSPSPSSRRRRRPSNLLVRSKRQSRLRGPSADHHPTTTSTPDSQYAPYPYTNDGDLLSS